MKDIRSNDFYIVLKCTDKKYAEDLMNKGTIMFNTARRWAEIEKESGKGQGDLYEGVFACCEADDDEAMACYKNKYRDTEIQYSHDLVYFKRSSVMDMPAFCFFLLKQNVLNNESSKNWIANIPGKYFEDFADAVSPDEIKYLKEEDKPSLVMILDMDKFINMIKSKLISFGVNNHEILTQVISYRDKKVPFYCINQSPYELFLKDKSFQYQKECRIVINTRDPEILKKIIRKPFDIGSIHEFGQVNYNFLNHDRFIKL